MKKPRAILSPGLVSCRLCTLRDSSRSSVSLTRCSLKPNKAIALHDKPSGPNNVASQTEGT